MTKNLRRIDPTEHQIQAAIVEWARMEKFQNPHNKELIIYLKDYLIAIPNGGNRSITEAIRLRKEGVKAGVSDLFLALPWDNGEFYCGLWIEVKSKNGKLSKAQREWLQKMSKSYKTFVIFTVDEGIQAIKDYLGMK